MTKAMEEARAIAQMFDDIYVRDGFCDWADVATARDEALRLHATALAARDAENERLREAQRRALANLAEGRNISYGVYGRSAHGGFTQTIYALRKRGYLDNNGAITPAGRAALEAGR